MKGLRLSHILTLALALSLCSCGRPTVSQSFIRATDAQNNIYSFELPLQDSLATYDLAFYTRIDNPFEKEVPSSLELQVKWVSPCGKSAEETVYMDCSKNVETYRSGVIPLSVGLWSLVVEVKNPPKGLRGLGLVCTENGTR